MFKSRVKYRSAPLPVGSVRYTKKPGLSRIHCVFKHVEAETVETSLQKRRKIYFNKDY